MVVIYPERFFTIWVSWIHVCRYLMKDFSIRIPSTFLLALIVFVGYCYIRVRVERMKTKPLHYYVFDLVGHTLPLLLIQPEISYESLMLTMVVLWLYLEFHAYDFCQIRQWYTNYIYYTFNAE